MDFRGRCLIYFKSQENYKYEAQLVEALTKIHISTQTVRSIPDLMPYTKESEIPGLLITDMSNDSDGFNNILIGFPNAYILCIHEDATGKRISKSDYFIKATKNFNQAIKYLISERQSPEFIARVYTVDTKEKATEETNVHPSVSNVEPVSNVEQFKQERIEKTKDTTQEVVKDSKNLNAIPLPIEQSHATANNTPTKETSEDGSVQYQENAYFKRSRNLQKQVFAKQKWEENRMIGIWSPLHRAGVTSLTMDFAFYLAQNRIYTAVLEGLTEQHALKDRLKRFTHVPAKWESYARAIQTDSNANHSEWTYRNVKFLPLNQEDSKYEWNSLSLESYMTTTKIVDVTLVDLPTGKMASYTSDTLHYLDELWIVVDDAIQETLAWKSYISDIEKNVGIPVSLIFNKAYPFSQIKRMGKELGLPVIATSPSLHEETMKNYYENIPLYFQLEVQAKLASPFLELATHLFGGAFEVKESVMEPKTNNWLTKIMKPLKG